MAAFSPTIRQFGDVTSRQKPWARWYKQHKGQIIIASILIIAAAAGAGAWWTWKGQYQATPGGQLDEGMVGQPQLLNPLYSDSNEVDAQLTPLLFRSLLKYNKHQELVGDLAQDYQISEDGKTYTLQLSQHNWHDGQPVTIDDVIFTINLTQDAAYKGPWSNRFTGVTATKITQDTLELKTDQTYAHFAQSLTLGILPKHILGTVPASQLATHQFNQEPIGSGKFKFQSRSVTEGKVERLKFEIQGGYLDAIEYHFYDDLQSMINDFKLGKIQSFGSLPNPMLSALEDLDKQQQHQVLTGQSIGIYFNLQSKNVQDLKVRQALAQGLNKEQILSQSVGSFWTKLNNVYPDASWADYGKLEPISHNLTQAQELLTQVKNPPSQLQIIIADPEADSQTAQLISQSWQKLGISTTIITKQGSALTAAIDSGQGYDAILLREKARQDPDRYNTWHSSQMPPAGHNISRLDNARIDRALADGRKTTDKDQRKIKYTTFQSLLDKEKPVIWLYQPHYIYTWSHKVYGVQLPSLWDESDRYQSIDDWYVNQVRKQ